MNSLPPELLTSIVRIAAQCDSTEESYRSRLETLSSLARVHRTFHHLAQPLLARKIVVASKGQWIKLQQTNVVAAIESLAAPWCQSERRDFSFDTTCHFVALRELRISGGYISMQTMTLFPRLVRLSFEHVYVWYPAYDPLSSLEELSLDNVAFEAPFVSNLFFAPERFPSLRALATRNLTQVDPEVMGSRPTAPPYSLLSQLDCFVTDDVKAGIRDDRSSRSSPDRIVPPILFDVDLGVFGPWSPPSTLAVGPARSRTHVRFRLACEPTPEAADLRTAVSLVDRLLDESTALKELYLDLYPRRGYKLDESPAAMIERIEDVERIAAKNVRVVWENHEDDWCRSLVSNEFWKRSKAMERT